MYDHGLAVSLELRGGVVGASEKGDDEERANEGARCVDYPARNGKWQPFAAGFATRCEPETGTISGAAGWTKDFAGHVAIMLEVGRHVKGLVNFD